VLWQHTFPLELKAYLFEGGPRSTPTVHNGKVYTVSWAGDLFCLDAVTGKQIWYKHLVNDFGGEAPDWGYSGSPFIDGNNVILDIGGKKESTVALNKETGALVWKNGRGAGGYATPVAVSVGAKRLLLVFKGKALVAHDPATGSVAWQQEWKTDYDVNAASPMVVKNKVLLSSGYNTGAGLFEFSAATIKQVWRNKDLAAHISTPVLHDGLLFGPHGECDKGPLRCVDWETGALKWEDRSIRGGALILAGNELIVVSSKGELHIGPAVAKGFVPRATLTLPKGRYWAQPTLANGAIFCRTNKGDVTCVE
jgi:outer membrane protein assembly factor BamB